MFRIIPQSDLGEEQQEPEEEATPSSDPILNRPRVPGNHTSPETQADLDEPRRFSEPG